MRSTAGATGMIFVIIIGAGLFTYFAALTDLPSLALGWIEGDVTP
nr:hypothetical protein [uncultured Sphingorhabdus sp.]